MPEIANHVYVTVWEPIIPTTDAAWQAFNSWVLHTGLWNDQGIWEDAALWADSDTDMWSSISPTTNVSWQPITT